MFPIFFSDIIGGGLDGNRLTNEYFVASYPYYYDELTWCVQKTRPIMTWENIFKLCNDPTVYISVSMICIVTIAFFYFMQQFENGSKWCWNRITFDGIRIICGFACELKPKMYSTRLFFGIVLLGCIPFVVTFLVTWLKCITTPFYEKQIASVEEMLHNRFEVVGNSIAFYHLKRQQQVIWRILI